MKTILGISLALVMLLGSVPLGFNDLAPHQYLFAEIDFDKLPLVDETFQITINTTSPVFDPPIVDYTTVARLSFSDNLEIIDGNEIFDIKFFTFDPSRKYIDLQIQSINENKSHLIPITFKAIGNGFGKVSVFEYNGYSSVQRANLEFVIGTDKTLLYVEEPEIREGMTCVSFDDQDLSECIMAEGFATEIDGQIIPNDQIPINDILSLSDEELSAMTDEEILTDMISDGYFEKDIKHILKVIRNNFEKNSIYTTTNFKNNITVPIASEKTSLRYSYIDQFTQCSNPDHVYVERPNGKLACVTERTAERTGWEIIQDLEKDVSATSANHLKNTFEPLSSSDTEYLKFDMTGTQIYGGYADPDPTYGFPASLELPKNVELNQPFIAKYIWQFFTIDKNGLKEKASESVWYRNDTTITMALFLPENVEFVNHKELGYTKYAETKNYFSFNKIFDYNEEDIQEETFILIITDSTKTNNNMRIGLIAKEGVRICLMNEKDTDISFRTENHFIHIWTGDEPYDCIDKPDKNITLSEGHAIENIPDLLLEPSASQLASAPEIEMNW